MKLGPLLLGLSLGASNSACRGDRKPVHAPDAPRPASGSAVEPYFPLDEGRLYNYVTTENGESGMLVAKVHRTDATHGELRFSNNTKRFVFAPGSVSYDTGVVLLKAPLAVGASWPGEHGGTTRVTSIDAAPKVLAGSYNSCVQTVEEGGRSPSSKYTSTYCPGVGMVLLEIQAGGGNAKAELKSYGMPFTID